MSMRSVWGVLGVAATAAIAACSAGAEAPANREGAQPRGAQAEGTKDSRRGAVTVAGQESCQTAYTCTGATCRCDSAGKEGLTCSGPAACETACAVCAGPAPDTGGRDAGGPGADAATDAGPPSDGSNGNEVCQSAYQCTNGACTCSGGPRDGQTCAEDACDTFCEFCQ